MACALGFPASYLAQRLGWSRATKNLGGPQPVLVRAKAARAARDLYDELWKAKPEQFGLRACAITTAKRRAAANGWALPAEWDDDEIDDPQARPHYARRTAVMDERPVTDAELADVRWIMRTVDVDLGNLAAREAVAARLGITEHRLEYIVLRKLPKLERQAARERDELAAAA